MRSAGFGSLGKTLCMEVMMGLTGADNYYLARMCTQPHARFYCSPATLTLKGLPFFFKTPTLSC